MQFLSYFFRQSFIQALKMCCNSYQNNAENTPTVAYTHSTQEDLVLVEIAAELCVQKSGTVGYTVLYAVVNFVSRSPDGKTSNEDLLGNPSEV